MVQYNVFPEGKKRIVTFSYDDGHRDEPLVALFNRYQVKATFHINGKEQDDCAFIQFSFVLRHSACLPYG